MKKILIVAILTSMSVSATAFAEVGYGGGGGSSSVGSGGSGGGGFAFWAPSGGQFNWSNYVAPIINLGNGGSNGSTPTLTPQVLGAFTSSNNDYTKNFKFGMKHEQIGKLQKFLLKNGYLKGKFHDCGFDMPTFNALKNFQKDNGIKATGFFGPKTRAFMNNLTGN